MRMVTSGPPAGGVGTGVDGKAMGERTHGPYARESRGARLAGGSRLARPARRAQHESLLHPDERLRGNGPAGLGEPFISPGQPASDTIGASRGEEMGRRLELASSWEEGGCVGLKPRLISWQTDRIPFHGLAL